MIKAFALYHGAVFSRLLHECDYELSLKAFPTKSNSSYVLNKNIGLYIKYSTKRMSPWSFSFKKEHQDEIQLMKDSLEEVYTILVCRDDGIVCLSFDELKKVLDYKHENIEWIRIARGRREKYAVAGKDGKLKCKIGDNEFPTKLFEDRET